MRFRYTMKANIQQIGEEWYRINREESIKTEVSGGASFADQSDTRYKVEYVCMLKVSIV